MGCTKSAPVSVGNGVASSSCQKVTLVPQELVVVNEPETPVLIEPLKEKPPEAEDASPDKDAEISKMLDKETAALAEIGPSDTDVSFDLRGAGADSPLSNCNTRSDGAASSGATTSCGFGIEATVQTKFLENAVAAPAHAAPLPAATPVLPVPALFLDVVPASPPLLRIPFSPKAATSQASARSNAYNNVASVGITLCLGGDALELIVAPGDVLSVKGSGRFYQIGAAGGFMGHVMLVLAPPLSIHRTSREAQYLEAIWPAREVEELWRVRTLESTRNAEGLVEADQLLYVDGHSGNLILCGELRDDEAGGGETTLSEIEREVVELWQSPTELRRALRVDLMEMVTREMKENRANWSHATAARAMLTSAELRRDAFGSLEEAMESIRESWKSEPICTSVIIVFWQRYLVELVGNSPEAYELILKWMPLKADRGLPGDLSGAMKACGWAQVVQIPRIFRHLLTAPLAQVTLPLAQLTGRAEAAGSSVATTADVSDGSHDDFRPGDDS